MRRPFYRSSWTAFAPLAALCLYTPGTLAQTSVLPDQAPIPEAREGPSPGTGQNAPAGALPSTDVPVPTPNPQADKAPPAGQHDNTMKPGAALPAEAPVPEKRPEKDDIAMPTEPPPEPVDPRSAVIPARVMPAEEKACRARLTQLGVEFEEHAARTDPAGCSIPYPLTVKSLGKDVALQPEAEMNCAIAEAAARFTRDVISPRANAEYGEELKSISHASAYVCRPRNGTRKLSEHAFGNALDIAAFTLANGVRIEVVLRPEEREARFLGALRKAACGPFKTVLGPGSDADHATHLHFDLAPRQKGGTFCQ